MFHNLSKKQDFSISNNLKSIEALTFKQTISLPTLRSGVRDLKIFIVQYFLTKDAKHRVRSA